MEAIKTNPKALNLDAIKLSQTKVTLGFKCYPKVKLDLAQKAQQLGLTLSEYVENLIMNHEKILVRENEKLITTNKELAQRIDFYENDFLKKLYQQYKNQSVEYFDSGNQIINLKIANIQDVYTVIINSFKIKENNG